MNNKKLILMVAFAFVTVLFLGGGQQAFARTYSVDDDRIECPNAQYTSIQAAVDHALAGDNIRVCPGLYEERVHIKAGKDNLKLFGTGLGEALIKAPAAPGDDPYAIVQINGAQNIVFRHFTVAGPLPDELFCGAELRAGISVIGGGSATIRDNVVRDIRSTSESLRGCPNGFAIIVGDSLFNQFGRATILRNVLERYQSAGIIVDGSDSGATIDGNDIHGIADNPDGVQNGIQVSRGADAEVRNNKVENHRYAPQTLGASGILTFQAGRVRVTDNEVNKNDYGIIFQEETDVRASQNLTTDNTYDGISLYTTTGAVIERNDSYSNGFDGIYIYFDSSNNTIRRNKSLFNPSLDAEDISIGGGTAGTANTWIRNRCDTDNRDGALCTDTDSGTGRNDSPILLGNGNRIRVTNARANRPSVRR